MNQSHTNLHALVIGIDQYKKPLKTLKNAVNDGKVISKVLSEQYGFTVKFLPNDSADKATILKSVEYFLKLGPEASWVFYFAGHGTVEGEKGYLLPSDAEKGDVGTFIEIQDLLQACNQSDLDQILIILDSCYSGRGFVRTESLDNPAPNPDERRVRQIITAGNPHERVLDGGGLDAHSLFTGTLLEVLNGWTTAHDEYNEIFFPKLRDELAYQLPTKLRALDLSTISQQPLGGNFQSNISGRQFSFKPINNIRRLPSELVGDLRSVDSERRVSGWKSIYSKEEITSPTQAIEMAVWSLINDPSESVREATAYALGKLPRNDVAVKTLIDALADEVSVCRAAAKSLGNLKIFEAGNILLQYLPNASVDLLMDLIEAIGETGDVQAIVSGLKTALQRNLLVPFIGPDLPQNLTGVISLKEFTVELARYTNSEPSNSLSQIANKATYGGKQFHSLVKMLKDSFDYHLQKPGPFYKALKNIGAPFWLSACYDNLLAKTIEANPMVMGEDTKYWEPGRPTVVRLLGDPGSIRGLVVLEKDYEMFRENEGDRKLLISFLQQELQGKIVLLLGFDPTSQDFKLLTKYILSQHLAGVSAKAFLVDTGLETNLKWKNQKIQVIQDEVLNIVSQLSLNS